MKAYEINEVTVPAYEVGGVLYHTRNEAVVAAIHSWCRAEGIGSGGEWDSLMVADAIVRGAADLFPLLADLSKKGAL